MERFSHPLLSFTMAAVFLVQYAGGKSPSRCPRTFRVLLASAKSRIRNLPYKVYKMLSFKWFLRLWHRLAHYITNICHYKTFRGVIRHVSKSLFVVMAKLYVNLWCYNNCTCSLTSARSVRENYDHHESERSWLKWPRVLRHERSSPARALRSCVRISLEAWMSMCVYFVLFFVQVAVLRRTDPPSKESYRLW
jgi:hypothetical protein